MNEGFGRESGQEGKDLEIAGDRTSTPERRPIKKELRILVPKDFELTEDGFKQALQAIQLRHLSRNSIDVFKANGYDYTGESVYPTPIYFGVGEIVGTESSDGWAGLVRNVGPVSANVRSQLLEEAYRHARRILDMSQSDRNNLLEGIQLAIVGSSLSRSFFVDSDGRHRIFTLKALAKLGCQVTISGMKVSVLERMKRF